MKAKQMPIGDFRKYLEKFESKVVVGGIEGGMFDKISMVPVRKGKLDKTTFGDTLGTQFEYDKPAAIDYYGLIKKSTGLVDQVSSNHELQVRAVKAPIVHFASIKIEWISDLAPDLVRDFPKFKKKIVSLRRFKKEPKPITKEEVSDERNSK